ncbi:LysR substrate-binding domain-containing protein [Amycolatopsis sp. NPDC051045]|uniref:LysR substrate-binding domain-containing protein n=1 Tax=Amycolatopsis sp. NPDC051045 TaxID=3156922 RepID=UPI00342B9B08
MVEDSGPAPGGRRPTAAPAVSTARPPHRLRWLACTRRGSSEEVRQGRLDAALVGLPEADLAGLAVLRVETRPFVALLPSAHRLAARRAVRLADLDGESFIDLPRGFGNRVVLDRAFDALGAPRRVTVEVADRRTVAGYVRAGLGVAVVPDTPAPDEPDVTVLPLAGAGLDWPLNLITASAKPPSRALRTLLDLIAGTDDI